MRWYRFCGLAVLSFPLQMAATEQNGKLHHTRLKKRRVLQKDYSLNPGLGTPDNGAALVDSSYLPNNDVCKRAFYLQPGDIVNGDNDYANIDSSISGCADTDFPGVWYVTNATGDLLQVEIRQVNHTEVAIFKGKDCNALTCNVAVDDSKRSQVGSRFWKTRKGETYFIYVYGRGEYQLILTRQSHPANDHADNATSLLLDTPLLGTTSFATPDQGLIQCKSGNKEGTSMPGVWYAINGTGAALKVHLKTVKEQVNSQVFLYTSSFQCMNDIEAIEYYDNRDTFWYPISYAYIWDSQKGETYFIQVQGETDSLSNFEITITENNRPVNDRCSEATPMIVDHTFQGSTSLANIDDVMACSANMQGAKPTAPGVWYRISGLEGTHRVAIISDYLSRLSVFSGDSCAELVCVAGTTGDSPNTTVLDVAPSSFVSWKADANKTYHVLVHGLGSLVGDFDLILTHAEASASDQPDNGSLPALASERAQSSVKIAISISFMFFQNTSLETPSKDDVDSLAEQTNLFFSQVFRDAYDDAFLRFEAEAFDSRYDEDEDFPVTVYFNVSIDLNVSASVPFSEEVYSLMSDSDLQSYIRQFVWQAQPVGSNIFFQTIRAVLGEEALPEGGHLSGVVEASMHRVDAKGKLLFGFFPYTHVREPTQAEVEALIDQTIGFFTGALGDIYGDFARFGAIDTNVDFIEGDDLPVIVYLDLQIFFYAPKSKNEAVHTPEDVSRAMSSIDLSEYIENYVWESNPFSANMFYETMHVVFEPESDNDTQATPTSESPLPQVSNPPDKVLLSVVLFFSFRSSLTTTMRSPEADEISGLLNQTEVFFSQFLKQELPIKSGFENLHMVLKSIEYKEESEFSVVVNTDVHVSFAPYSTVESYVTADQILALMEVADMKEYVEFYVWFSKPEGSVFFATKQVVLEPYSSVGSGAAPETTAPDHSLSLLPTVAHDTSTHNASIKTLIRVETDATLIFNFFPGTDTSRGPSEGELGSLTAQTKKFFTNVLNDAFETFVRLDLDLLTAGYAESDTVPTTVVAWKLETLLYAKEDETGESETSQDIMSALRASDIEDYVHNYVWSCTPIGGNLFFSTDAVQFENWGDTNEGEPTPAPTQHQTSILTIQATISYGFLPDQIISREPTGKELQPVLIQTSLFFNKLFRDTFSESFRRCEVGVKDVELVQNSQLPVSVSYEMIVHFKNVPTVPSSEEMYQAIDGANFEEYIEFYIWNADPSAESMFYDTQEVVFQGMV